VIFPMDSGNLLLVSVARSWAERPARETVLLGYFVAELAPEPPAHG
jgi:hypothetical protein